MSYHLLSTQVSQTKKGFPTLAISQPNNLNPTLNTVPRGTVALRVKNLQAGQSTFIPGPKTDNDGLQGQSSPVSSRNHIADNLTGTLSPSKKSDEEKLQNVNSKHDLSPAMKHEDRSNKSDVTPSRTSSEPSEIRRPLPHSKVLQNEIITPNKYAKKTTPKFSARTSESSPTTLTSKQGFCDIFKDDHTEMPRDQGSESNHQKNNKSIQNPPGSFYMHFRMNNFSLKNRPNRDSRLHSSSGVSEMEESGSYFGKVFEPTEQERDRMSSLQFENGTSRKFLERPKPSPIQFSKSTKDKGTGPGLSRPKKLDHQKINELPTQSTPPPLPLESYHYLARGTTRVRNSPFFIRDMTNLKIPPDHKDNHTSKQERLFPKDSPTPPSNPAKYINSGYHDPHLEQTKPGNSSHWSVKKVKQALPEGQDSKLSVAKNHLDNFRTNLASDSTPDRLRLRESIIEKATNSLGKASNSIVSRLSSGNNSENNQLDTLQNLDQRPHSPLSNPPHKFPTINARSKSDDVRQRTERDPSFLGSQRVVSPSNSRLMKSSSDQKKISINSSSESIKRERNLFKDKLQISDKPKLSRRQSTVSMFELSDNIIDYDLYTGINRKSWKNEKEKRDRRQRLINIGQIKKNAPYSSDSTINFKGQDTNTYEENPTPRKLMESVPQATYERLLDLPHINLAYHDSLWKRNLNDESRDFQTSHKVPLNSSSIRRITLTFHLEGNEEIVFDTVPRIG
ncbi:hypothetical protein K3495_g9810 [Podosphaera aphanis]|nr:hypothetical protein K3495_g9810 [Podosphaera aphanis]